MAVCSACGAKIRDEDQFCPHCGAAVRPMDDRPVRDYWAEQLAGLEEEDWTEEIEDEELPDLNEEEKPELQEVMDSVRPPEKKKGIRVRNLCILLALILTIGALGLGLRKPGRGTEGSGRYYSCALASDGKNRKNPGDFVDLGKDGTMTLWLLGSEMEGHWQLSGQAFSGFMDHRTIEGELKDGVLSFEYGKAQMVFALPEKMDSVLARQETVFVTVPEKTEDYEAWTGDYYGTLLLKDGTGAWAGNSGESYDVCGRIRTEETGTGRFSLWNEENKPGDRFLTADVLFSPGTTDQGKMSVQWGMLYDMELGPGEWSVDPGKSPYSYLKDLLYLSGTYMDPAEPGNTFRYEIFLKPWGEIWEEISQEDAFLLPPGYSDWYLPLVRAGQRMPEQF